MRVVRAFAFVDLCGFTSFTHIHGDDNAVQILARFRALAREIAARRGVRLAKWLGDGVMLVSVDGPPLVAAVLELEARMDEEHSPLSIRVGLAAGAVIPFEGEDYIGTPVNLASRLCDAAAGHEVVVDLSLADSLPPWAEAAEPEKVSVPGFIDPVTVLRLRRRDGDEPTVTDPVCGMSLPPHGVVAVRVIPGQGLASFCSNACADAWDGNAARTRSMAEGI